LQGRRFVIFSSKSAGGGAPQMITSLRYNTSHRRSQVGKIGGADGPPDPPQHEILGTAFLGAARTPRDHTPHHPCRLLMEEATGAGKESLKSCITKAGCKRASSVPDEEGGRRSRVISTNGDRYLYDHVCARPARGGWCGHKRIGSRSTSLMSGMTTKWTECSGGGGVQK